MDAGFAFVAIMVALVWSLWTAWAWQWLASKGRGGWRDAVLAFLLPPAVVLGFLALAGCTGTRLEYAYQAEFDPLPEALGSPTGYLFTVKLNALNGDNPATEAMIERYLDWAMEEHQGCDGGPWYVAGRNTRPAPNALGADLRRATMLIVCGEPEPNVNPEAELVLDDNLQ